MMLLLILVVKVENKRRDRAHGVVEELSDVVVDETLVNEVTDGKNTSFRYVI
jgi:hypothetical protein